jgi:hypothetical protein
LREGEIVMRVAPEWLRWVSVLFGLATVPFLYIAVLDAHTASVVGRESVFYDDLVLGVVKRLTYAVICLAIAVLPAVWSTFPRRFDSP